MEYVLIALCFIISIIIIKSMSDSKKFHDDIITQIHNQERLREVNYFKTELFKFCVQADIQLAKIRGTKHEDVVMNMIYNGFAGFLNNKKEMLNPNIPLTVEFFISNDRHVEKLKELGLGEFYEEKIKKEKEKLGSVEN